MPRYFEKFWIDQPMVELDENDAHARAEYVLELEEPLRYELWFDGVIEVVYYPENNDPAQAQRDSAQRYPGLPIEIHSTRVERAGRLAWRTWYVEDGAVLRSVHTETSTDDSPFHRTRLLDQDGNCVSYTEHHYDSSGELLEIATYAPDGAVLNVEYDGE